MTGPRTEAGKALLERIVEWEQQEYGTESTPETQGMWADDILAIEAEAAASLTDGGLREAVIEMFRAEAMICVACGLVMAPSDVDMIAAHEADARNGIIESADCLSVPLRRALRAVLESEAEHE